MNIACVDKTAADRLHLQKRLEDAYEYSRKTVGHISILRLYPASKEEVVLHTPPDLIFIGPGFAFEEAFRVCRDLSKEFPNTVLFLFLPPELYTLRTLRRFQRFCSEIFSTEEAPTRLVHRLTTFEHSAKRKSGKLITLLGVKGGVGTTSIVSGLAHAAQGLGYSAVILDLSEAGSLVQYMFSRRWHSPDFSATLIDGLIPDQALVERCIEVAPNGIHLFLPPSGGMDVRELWLRHSERFEISLTIVDILKDLYEIVLVDCGGTEGILRFALGTRADRKVLISSNEPASVHLLGTKFSQEAHTPGDAQISILINELWEKALCKQDIEEFLSLNSDSPKSFSLLSPLLFDAQGRNWVGTGNTFYTESKPATQIQLERIIATLLHPDQLVCVENEQQKKLVSPKPIIEGMLRFIEGIQKRRSKHRDKEKGEAIGTIGHPLLEREQAVAEQPSKAGSHGSLTTEKDSVLLMPIGQGAEIVPRMTRYPVRIAKTPLDSEPPLSLYQSPQPVDGKEVITQVTS